MSNTTEDFDDDFDPYDILDDEDLCDDWDDEWFNALHDDDYIDDDKLDGMV